MCVFNEQETKGKRVLGYEKRNKRVWEAKRKGNYKKQETFTW